MHLRLFSLLSAGCLLLAFSLSEGGEKGGGVVIDKGKRTITIPCKVAARKLANLDKIYPLEVVACWPAPRLVTRAK